jgi:hypothetical protein
VGAGPGPGGLGGAGFGGLAGSGGSTGSGGCEGVGGWAGADVALARAAAESLGRVERCAGMTCPAVGPSGGGSVTADAAGPLSSPTR